MPIEPDQPGEGVGEIGRADFHVARAMPMVGDDEPNSAFLDGDDLLDTRPRAGAGCIAARNMSWHSLAGLLALMVWTVTGSSRMIASHVTWEKSMIIARFGLDISKNVFQVHGVASDDSIVVRQQLRRHQVLAFFRDLPPCIVSIEACPQHIEQAPQRPCRREFRRNSSRRPH